MDRIASDELAVSEPERPERPECVWLCKLAAPGPSGGPGFEVWCHHAPVPVCRGGQVNLAGDDVFSRGSSELMGPKWRAGASVAESKAKAKALQVMALYDGRR